MGAVVAQQATALPTSSSRPCDAQIAPNSHASPTFGDPPYSLALSTKLRDVEPPHSYLREPSASVVHHADYLNDRDDQTLCGAALQNPTASTRSDAADAPCPDCEAQLVKYHLEWWRERALEATAELEQLRARYGDLQETADTEIPTPAAGQTNEEPSEVSPADSAEAEPTTLLDRARRELTELCRQFDGAVPYWRLKNTMQDFNDGLDTNQRVLLAEEISTDGSLIRWATVQIETRGWQVTNSPVQENSERMWEEWLQESHQAPKKSKRRFGRSRSE
jgi:hypothetical protein